jgi:hypothetical protein
MSVENETTPQETNPVASTPSPAADSPQATTPSADPSLSAGSSEGEASPSAPSAAPADPRAEIDALATEHGFQPADFANYQDVNSARAALTAHVDDLARKGLSGVAQPTQEVPQQQAPQQKQAPPAQSSLDLASLGLDENDPAAKAIRAIEQQLTTSQQQVAQVAQVLQKVQSDTSSRSHQQLVGQAESVVASFESPEYGVVGNRTASQEWNTQRLFDLADAIAVGAHNDNRPIPPLQARLNQARLIDAQAKQPAIGGQPIQPPASQTPPPHVPLQQHGFSTQGEVQPMGMADKWSSNPELMRLINDAGN